MKWKYAVVFVLLVVFLALLAESVMSLPVMVAMILLIGWASITIYILLNVNRESAPIIVLMIIYMFFFIMGSFAQIQAYGDSPNGGFLVQTYHSKYTTNGSVLNVEYYKFIPTGLEKHWGGKVEFIGPVTLVSPWGDTHHYDGTIGSWGFSRQSPKGVYTAYSIVLMSTWDYAVGTHYVFNTRDGELYGTIVLPGKTPVTVNSVFTVVGNKTTTLTIDYPGYGVVSASLPTLWFMLLIVSSVMAGLFGCIGISLIRNEDKRAVVLIIIVLFTIFTVLSPFVAGIMVYYGSIDEYYPGTFTESIQGAYSLESIVTTSYVQPVPRTPYTITREVTILTPYKVINLGRFRATFSFDGDKAYARIPSYSLLTLNSVTTFTYYYVGSGADTEYSIVNPVATVVFEIINLNNLDHGSSTIIERDYYLGSGMAVIIATGSHQ